MAIKAYYIHVPRRLCYSKVVKGIPWYCVSYNIRPIYYPIHVLVYLYGNGMLQSLKYMLIQLDFLVWIQLIGKIISMRFAW